MMSKVKSCVLSHPSSSPATTIWLGLRVVDAVRGMAAGTIATPQRLPRIVCRLRIAACSGSICLRHAVRPLALSPFSALSTACFGALSLLAFLSCRFVHVLRPFALLLLPCWCVLPVRLVFLCVPHAQACRKLRGTRDTTPDLCRSLCCLPRLHPSWRRCRASCWSRSIELSCFTRRPAGRDRVAVVQRARGERAMAGIALRDQKEMVQRGPSLELHHMRQRT